MFRFEKHARLLEAARRDANGSFRESFRTPSGHRIACHSKGELDWWEQFSEALTSKQLRPDDLSIKDIFLGVVPDGYALCEEWKRGGGVSLLEAAGAISTAQFTNITGQIVYSAILEGYQSEAFTMTAMIPTVHSDFLDGEKIPGVGGIGNKAEVVTEGNQYPLVGISENWVNTPAGVKRGEIAPVTKEIIFADRTNLVLSTARMVGEDLGINKEIRAIDCVIDENTTAHRHNWKGTTYATYQTSTPWINDKTSNALENWTNIDAIEQLAANMADPMTGLPIIIDLNTLIVNKENLHNAYRLLNAEQLIRVTSGFVTNATVNQTVSPNSVGKIAGYSPSLGIVSSRYMKARTATDTMWYVCDPKKAFVYMENWPITMTQAPANSEAEFNRDIVAQFKASERGAYFVKDPRYTFRSAV